MYNHMGAPLLCWCIIWYKLIDALSSKTNCPAVFSTHHKPQLSSQSLLYLSSSTSRFRLPTCIYTLQRKARLVSSRAHLWLWADSTRWSVCWPAPCCWPTEAYSEPALLYGTPLFRHLYENTVRQYRSSRIGYSERRWDKQKTKTSAPRRIAFPR